MKRNLTLSVDQDLLDRVRIVAARRRTSVTELVRRHLELLAASETEHEDAAAWLRARMADRPLFVGGRQWTRDELHER